MRIPLFSFVAALGAVVFFGSCGHSGEAVSRDKLYNNATNADSEAFTFLKTSHEKAVLETRLAQYVQTTSASAEAKQLASSVARTYETVIPALEVLATDKYVILPSPDMPAFTVPKELEADSVSSFKSDLYIQHVQHEQGILLEQFKRAENNTSKALRDFAKSTFPSVKALFAEAGGKEAAGAHH